MNMTSYFRPIVRTGSPRSKNSIFLAETNYWVSEAEEIKFGEKTKLVSINDVPDWWKKRWLKKRSDILGMEFGFPKLMGILNVTPDSFSDGGNHIKLAAALNQAKFMEENGADIIDIGGESTRPGALTVPISEEIKRIEPVINGISARSKIPISVDTRKSEVASAARKAGASMVNDVSGFTFDPDLLPYCSKYKLPVFVGRHCYSACTIISTRSPILYASNDTRFMFHEGRADGLKGYNIEDYRVGQKTDFEKLNFNITTDGSLDPKQALTEASKILIQHFMLFSDEKINLEEEIKETMKFLSVRLF